MMAVLVTERGDDTFVLSSDDNGNLEVCVNDVCRGFGKLCWCEE